MREQSASDLSGRVAVAQVFEKQDMACATFREVNLREAVFGGVNFAGAIISNTDLKGLWITGMLRPRAAMRVSRVDSVGLTPRSVQEG